MTPEQLRKAGETLASNDPETYGRGWKSALSRKVGVGPRTVFAWLAGDHRISETAGILIKRLVAESRK